jgi:hypothetical protein
MRRTQLLQEIRKMQFEEIVKTWTESRLTQDDAARMLGVCARTFRRYLGRYREQGLEGLQDKRLMQASARTMRCWSWLVGTSTGIGDGTSSIFTHGTEEMEVCAATHG